MELQLIDRGNYFDVLSQVPKPWQEAYLSMYSSQWHGIVTDPALMMLPIDDHVAHRGDGVFDTMRCVNGKIYQMDAHLERLERSAQAISLAFPPEYGDIRTIIKRAIVIGGRKDCLIRVVISRGPGSFSTNPFDCHASQLYVNVIRYKALPEKYYREGIPIMTSKVPVKKPFFATIKSCNYLPNVLMKMEAVKAGHRYSVALDDENCLAEGSTENVGILSSEGILKFPGFEKTLAGTTVSRVFELSKSLIRNGLVKGIEFAKISLKEAYSCREMMLLGTSINILPVSRLDGHAVGRGLSGPISSKLFNLLWKDMTENRNLLTDTE